MPFSLLAIPLYVQNENNLIFAAKVCISSLSSILDSGLYNLREQSKRKGNTKIIMNDCSFVRRVGWTHYVRMCLSHIQRMLSRFSGRCGACTNCQIPNQKSGRLRGSLQTHGRNRSSDLAHLSCLCAESRTAHICWCGEMRYARATHDENEKLGINYYNIFENLNWIDRAIVESDEDTSAWCGAVRRLPFGISYFSSY